MTPEIEHLVDDLKEQLKGAEQTADFIILTEQYIRRLYQTDIEEVTEK